MPQPALVGTPGVEVPGGLRIARCCSTWAIVGAMAMVTASVIWSLEAALTMLRRVHLRNMPMVILPMKL
jgi:hypothetical protein